MRMCRFVTVKVNLRRVGNKSRLHVKLMYVALGMMLRVHGDEVYVSIKLS